MRPAPLKVTVFTGILCLLWGSTWVVIKSGLESLPPFGSAAVRFALAAACMSVLAHLFAKREGGGRPALRLAAVLGLVNFAGSYGIVYWSETRLPSALVSVLWAVYPMIQAVVGHLFLRGERIAAAQGFGFAVGFLGVGALFLTDLRSLGPEAVARGRCCCCRRSSRPWARPSSSDTARARARCASTATGCGSAPRGSRSPR